MDTRIGSDLSTSNATDNYYEADHSKYIRFLTGEYSSRRRIRGGKNYHFINWTYQSETKKKQWTSDDFWDDPNKLVDRLRVLIVEQNMTTLQKSILFLMNFAKLG